MTSPYAQKNTREHVEDCRDYLRTGRCKYGAACKFRHPPNVQTGGGMKAPIDPSEPLFPIRPNEPVCQYYMKHGTCKFGQACKFHHPPQSSMTTNVMGSNAILIPRSNSDGSSMPQHILLNPAISEKITSTMMLQFLPQRPDEPDCIYFLRNGTCKYGATCRYHHPVNNYQQRKSIELQRRQQQEKIVQISSHVTSDGTVQYVKAQQPLTQSGGGRVVATSNGGHILVTETPVQVLPVNHGNFPQVSLPIANIDHGGEFNQTQSVSNGTGIVCISPDHASSSSSLASSYEAANSSLDYITPGQGNWNRPPRRCSSGGNLSGFAEVQPVRQHGHIRRLRTASFGSIGSSSEHSNGYHENSIGWSGGNGQLPVYQEQFHSENLFEHKQNSQSHFHINKNPLQMQSHEQTRTNHRQDFYQPQTRQTCDIVDHGLSMMTSALLNMLDTSEEALAKTFSSRISSSSTSKNNPSPPVIPRSTNIKLPQDSTKVKEQHFSQQVGINRGYHYPEMRHQIMYAPQSTSEHSMRVETMKPLQYLPIFPTQSGEMYCASKEIFNNVEPVAISHKWNHSIQETPLTKIGEEARTKSMHHRSEGAAPQSNISLYLP
mmetsp:Transcript_39233/g.44743  ORF Transcript_39233/g.44743 Transcript_39233/m.44743 type:complete len:603 (-) Transcript_39233:156-1964(-)